MKQHPDWREAKVVMTPEADKAVEKINAYLERSHGARPSLSGAIRCAVLNYAQWIDADPEPTGAA